MLATACLALAWLTPCSLHGSSGLHSPTTQVAKAHETQQQRVSAEYVDWLERRSMLEQSRQLAPLVSGEGMQWRHEYADAGNSGASRDQLVRAPFRLA